MSFDAKSGILKAINETNDPAMKTVLLLLLGVFEEIVDKIDDVLHNEQVLRERVLNGHEPVHHKHHEWVAQRMNRDSEIEPMISWVKLQMEEQKDGKRWRMDVAKSVIAAAIIAAGSFLIGKAYGAEPVAGQAVVRHDRTHR